MLPKQYKGYKVVHKDSRVLKDYEGMNYYAAKEMGFKPCPKKNEVWIDTRTTSAQQQRKDMVHEVVEANLMKHHEKYWSAHQKALKAEKRKW